MFASYRCVYLWFRQKCLSMSFEYLQRRSLVLVYVGVWHLLFVHWLVDDCNQGGGREFGESPVDDEYSKSVRMKDGWLESRMRRCDRFLCWLFATTSGWFPFMLSNLKQIRKIWRDLMMSPRQSQTCGTRAFPHCGLTYVRKSRFCSLFIAVRIFQGEKPPARAGFSFPLFESTA